MQGLPIFLRNVERYVDTASLSLVSYQQLTDMIPKLFLCNFDYIQFSRSGIKFFE